MVLKWGYLDARMDEKGVVCMCGVDVVSVSVIHSAFCFCLVAARCSEWSSNGTFNI